MKNIVALLLLVGSFAVFAEEDLNYNLISLNAKAQQDVPNDLMRAVLKVERKSKTAAIVSDQVNKDMAWALKQVKSIKKIKSETGQYNTYPMYEKSNITGWRASQQLILESEDFKVLSQSLKQLQNKLHIVSMQFVPKKSTRDKIEAELVTKAIKAFRERAKLVTKAMDGRSYDVVNMHINEQGGYSPIAYRAERSMKRSFAMDAVSTAPSVSAGDSTMSVSINGRIQIEY